MKYFVFTVLLATAAIASPIEDSKREKRGYLHSGISLGYDNDYSLYGGDYSHGYSSYEGYNHGYSGYEGYNHGFELEHAPIYHHEPIVHHEPVHKVVSYNKVVEVPKVIEHKKVISVPEVVTVPHVLKVSKIVEDPHHHISYSAPSISHGHHGWW